MTLSTTTTPSGSQGIDGVLAFSGTPPNVVPHLWNTTSLTYSFPSSGSFYESDAHTLNETATFQAFDNDQKAAARHILDTISQFTKLAFTELTESLTTHAIIRFGNSDAPEDVLGGSAYAFPPGSSPENIAGDAWFDNDAVSHDMAVGDLSYFTFMHEIGHTLGLDHGHEGFVALPSSRDSVEYSVMTYRSFVGDNNFNGYNLLADHYPRTYMQDDIAALQYLYGANYEGANKTDSVYTWHQGDDGTWEINGVDQGSVSGRVVFQTVWDSGGDDTYDFSAFNVGYVIADMRPGGWISTTENFKTANLGLGHNAAGIVANALLDTHHDGVGDERTDRSLIENIKATSNGDNITSNDAGGWIEGRGGADAITLGAGGRSLWETFTEIKDADRGSGSYNASEGDHINVAAITETYYNKGWGASSLARIEADPGGFSELQVDFDGAGSRSGWITIAKLDGMTAGQTLDVNPATGVTVSLLSTANLSGDWTFKGYGQFGYGSTKDAMWQDDTGALNMWASNDPNSNVAITQNPAWNLEAVGDFDGDGLKDLFFHNGSNTAVWEDYNNAAAYQTQANMSSLNSTWHAAGAGDLNNDGKEDIVFHNESGLLAVWFMNGTSQSTVVLNDTLDPEDWFLAGIKDVNNNGKADLLWESTDNTIRTVWEDLNTSTGAFADRHNSDWELLQL